MISTAATTGPVFRILSYRGLKVEGREGASTGPSPSLHDWL